MCAKKTLASAVLDYDCLEGELVKCKGILLQSNQCSKSDISLSFYFGNYRCVFPFLFLSVCLCERASLSL